MVDTSAFDMQGSAGGGPATFFIKNKEGQIVEVEIAKDQFKPPVSGYYTLKLKGLSAPFEMQGGAQYGPSKNVRAVFVVIAPGTENDKRMFSQLLAIAKKDKTTGQWKSNLSKNSAPGKMIGVIRGKDIEEGEPINMLTFLNGTFCGVVNQTVKTTEDGVQVYGSVVKDTWAPVPQQSTQPVAQPASQPVAAGNVFMDDDE